jgi:hypothetical protein
VVDLNNKESEYRTKNGNSSRKSDTGLQEEDHISIDHYTSDEDGESSVVDLNNKESEYRTKGLAETCNGWKYSRYTPKWKAVKL